MFDLFVWKNIFFFHMMSDSMDENIWMLFAWMNLFAFLYILYFYMNMSLNIPNNIIIIKKIKNK
jgi:hypothetical protein